jgi:hypothetical protein
MRDVEEPGSRLRFSGERDRPPILFIAKRALANTMVVQNTNAFCS